IDIRKFGGLARSLRITAGTFWIGGLALAGFPLLSGFWSKDEIIHAAFEHNQAVLGVLALITAALTAFYTFRMIFWAFHGPEKLPDGVDHAHESGGWMTFPLFVLSIGAAGAGFLGHQFHEFLSPVLPYEHHAEGAMTMMVISGIIAIL